MTSTSFNTGLIGERNSSRVLRPPGGGHSDIFGVRDNDNGIVTPSKRRNQPQSTIGGCFNMVDDTKEKDLQDKEITTNGNEAVNENENEAVNGNEKNEVDNGIDENKAPSEPEVKKVEEVQTSGPKRVRVPPGGFSNGLW